MIYLLKSFLKVGSISFGGFMALIGVLQKEMVERDGKLEDEVLMDGVSLASLLPGPVAVNTVGYIGYQLRGFWGGLLSMAAVILPSFVLVLGLSFVYMEFGNVDQFQSAISLVMPAIVAIIVQVGVNMGRKHLHNWKQYIIAALAFTVLQIIGGFWATIGILITSGLLGYILFQEDQSSNKNANGDGNSNRSTYLGVLVLLGFTMAGAFLVDYIFTGGTKMNMNLLGTFSGMSLTLFGGGYVIIPIIQETIVSELSWLTLDEFNTAIAVSQITPGPILISATFIGYKVGSWPGAVFATIGIFLPSGLLMIVCSHYLGLLKNSRALMAIFKGLRPAIVGLVFSGALTTGVGIIGNVFSILAFVITLILALRFKFSAILLILTSVGVGLLGLI